jgi:hypothetical protein
MHEISGKNPAHEMWAQEVLFVTPQLRKFFAASHFE